MKSYNIQSKNTGDVIVTTCNIKEAYDLAEAYENNHFDEAIILDEEGNLVDDWYDFVYEIVRNSDSGCLKMDLYDAHLTLNEWKEEGIEIPAGLDAETFQLIWNEAIVDLDRMIMIPEETAEEPKCEDDNNMFITIHYYNKYGSFNFIPFVNGMTAAKKLYLRLVWDGCKRVQITRSSWSVPEETVWETPEKVFPKYDDLPFCDDLPF